MLEELIKGGAAAEDLVRMLRILSDPTRLRLIALLERGERNVSSLCKAMEVAQPTVSHHLAMLRSVKLVETRRDGKQVFYSLNPKRVTQNAPGEAPGASLAFSSGPVEFKLTNVESSRPRVPEIHTQPPTLRPVPVPH